MVLAWWLVPCLPFPGLPHIYFLFTMRLRFFHVCCNENFRNSYLSFYWKKWFYIWYMALAWWLVLCLLFPGLPHIYFLFSVWLTNKRVGVFLARRSVQHLVWDQLLYIEDLNYSYRFNVRDFQYSESEMAAGKTEISKLEADKKKQYVSYSNLIFFIQTEMYPVYDEVWLSCLVCSLLKFTVPKLLIKLRLSSLRHRWP